MTVQEKSPSTCCQNTMNKYTICVEVHTCNTTNIIMYNYFEKAVLYVGTH